MTYRFRIEVYQKALEWVGYMVDFALARGEDVVISDVFPFKSDLDPFLEIAEAHGASVEVITCTGNYGNNHSVPLMVLKQMKADFEYIPDGMLLEAGQKRKDRIVFKDISENVSPISKGGNR